MEELRSVTPHRPVYGKGKWLRNSNSNVTVVQMKAMPLRGNRRVDKEIIRAEASDLQLITVKPATSGEARSSLLKLHILNLRTGKIQDAVINTDDGESYKPQLHRKSAEIKSRNFSEHKKLIRIQQHSRKPETVLNQISVDKKFALKPYKQRNKFTSTKCKCEDKSRMWNCKKIQISIARCHSNQYLCCSGH